MIDFVKLQVRAGDGGNGRVSFLRQKYMTKGGPEGGTGGDGGSIIIRASEHRATLKQFSGVKHYIAEPGAVGGRKNMSGANGEDVYLEVPLGTEVRVLAENKVAQRRRKKFGIEGLLTKEHVEMQTFTLPREGAALPLLDPDELVSVSDNENGIVIAQLLEDGQEVVLAQGGFGGKGNEAYKSSVRTTPLIAEYGTFGEKRDIILELKLLADIGLVGYPNAGKSTIVSSLTGARTKIGAYPFTTLEPHLGMLRAGSPGKFEKELIVADIPGLIEGASEGRGLGHDFLRHVEHCRVLWFILALDEQALFDDSLSIDDKSQLILKQYRALQTELEKHNEDLLNKRTIVSLNKIDIYTKELIESIVSLFDENDIELHILSAATGEGVAALKEEVMHLAMEDNELN